MPGLCGVGGARRFVGLSGGWGMCVAWFRTWPRAVARFSTVALCLGLALPAPAAARVVNGAAFGGWTVLCEAVAVNETMCGLSQRLVRNDGSNRLLADLLAIPGVDDQPPVLVVRVPLGVHFPGGFALRAEGQAAGEPLVVFDWQSCSTELCEALALLDPGRLAALEGVDRALAAYRPEVNADPLVFRVRLDGLTEGLAALTEAIRPTAAQGE